MSWSTYFSQNLCLKPVDASQWRSAPLVSRLQEPKAQSPYYPDREVAKEKQIRGSQEETQWKEVPSYHDQHSHTVQTNLKKINIL